jgi:hypothetical protein
LSQQQQKSTKPPSGLPNTTVSHEAILRIFSANIRTETPLITWYYEKKEWMAFCKMKLWLILKFSLLYGIGFAIAGPLVLIFLGEFSTKEAVILCSSTGILYITWNLFKGIRLFGVKSKNPSVSIFPNVIQINNHKIHFNAEDRYLEDISLLTSDTFAFNYLKIEYVTRNTNSGTTNLKNKLTIPEIHIPVPYEKLEEAEKIVQLFESVKTEFSLGQFLDIFEEISSL